MNSLPAPRAPLRGLLVALAAASAFALVGAPESHAAACTTSWASATSGDWGDDSSWTAGVPDSSDVACIQLDGDYQVDVLAESGDVGDAIANAKELHLGGTSGTQTILVQGRAADAANHPAALGLAGGSGSASDVNSHGVIEVEGTDASNNAMLCATSPLTNGGTISTAGTVGQLQVLGGTIMNGVGGAVSIGADTLIPSVTCGSSSFDNDGGTVNISNSRTLNVAGTYLQGSGTTDLGDDGRMAVAGSLTMTGGSFTGVKAPVVNDAHLGASAGSGTFSVRGATALISGVGPNVTVNAEGTASADATITTENGALQNQGTINLTSIDSTHGSRLRASAGAITNTGTIATLPGAGGVRQLGKTIDNQGSLLIGADTSSESSPNALSLTNSANGVLEVESGSKLSLTDFTQNGGSVGIVGTLDDGGVVTINAGHFEGSGTVKATSLVNNAGTVAPGDSPGILSVQGNYSQGGSGTLDIEVAGPDAGTGFSQLAVTGTANLNGTLKVTTTGAQHDRYPVLQAASVSGQFSGTSFTGQSYGVQTNSNNVTLVAAPFNRVKPSIAGVPRVGNTLTCNRGIWRPQGSAFTFQYRWLQDGVPIGGATFAKRKVLPSDQGHKLTCRVIATNIAGSRSATSNPRSVPREPAQRGTFRNKSPRATKAGDVMVPVRNPNPLSAAGALTLRNTKGKVVGQTKFQIAKRSTKRIKVHLSKGAFAKLTAKGQLKAPATLVLSRGTVKKTATATLTLKSPKP